MKTLFCWWWNRAIEIYPLWRDGLRAALEELNKDHQVDIFLGEVTPPSGYDFYLLWGDSNCTAIDILKDYKARKGIVLTTDPHNIENLRKLDVVYCESSPVYEAVKAQGIRAIRAFGTDTDFYNPGETQGVLVMKDIEYFYPATFSPWKKQSTIAYLGNKLVCVGTVQPDGLQELGACRSNNVQIREGYFPPETIRDCYMRANYVPIPAIHGSERTCLEAMSMNIVPTVNPENKRTISYVEEYIHSGYLTPRDFVVANYSASVYAAALKKGMNG